MYCEETARRNAERINQVYNGLFYCPKCGYESRIDPDSYGEEFKCPACEAERNEDVTMEVYDLYDYLDPVDGEILEISEFICPDRHTGPTDVRVCLGYGGPNIYIDTKKEVVSVYWGFDYAEYPVEHEACEEIVRIAREIWDSQ